MRALQCQEHATCAYPEALGCRNRYTISQKSLVVGLIFKSIFLKIHMNHFGAPDVTNFKLCFAALHKLCETCEVVACFNCEQVRFLGIPVLRF